MKMSPSYSSALNYYLTNVLLFTNLDFSLKAMTAEMFLFAGIIFLNTIFKNTTRSTFLKTNGFLYVVTSAMLIPMLYVLKSQPDIPPMALVLIYTGLHALFFEIFSLPIVGIFLEICPENLEGFFMSLIFFMNNFSKNIGTFFGTLCIYALGISAKEMSHLSILIAVHFVVSLAGFLVLLFSKIPERKKHKDKEEVEQVENNHLAYIDTRDSILIDDELLSNISQQFDSESQNVSNFEMISGRPTPNEEEPLKNRNQNEQLNSL
jgi:hypothetical protein